MMKKVRGAVSVMMTTLLIGVVSVLALSVFRTLIQSQHISQGRINNIIREWNLKGISDCVAEKIIQLPFSTSFSHCLDDEGVYLEVTHGMKRDVTVKEKKSEVSFSLKLPEADRAGVIKSTMNLVFLRDVSISPDPGKSTSKGRWECSSILYSRQLYAQSLSSSHPYLSPLMPYWGFMKQGARCDNRHYSVSVNPSAAKADFRKLPILDPFFDLWHISAGDWFSLMSDSLIGHVPVRFENSFDGTLVYSEESRLPPAEFNPSCEGGIDRQLQKGKRIIWVYGGCELNDDGISRINSAIDSAFKHGGVIIVVQNGILSIHADISLHALIIQMITGESVDYASQWSRVGNVSHIMDDISHQPFPSLKKTLSLDSLAYYQSGLFYPEGGLILIGEHFYSLIKSRYFAIQKDLITEALSVVRPVERAGGSWDEK
ncbi:hypothetical protein [Vibrio salinus]|uniref:hypothetical protein n=1 Tax=Vibrio salinus TaxID=2899784 RepID=UPI001E5BF5E2|nr:hypothetical protein [Vibrio salinus]MCE0493087.1 hypothetical protein [Vibrio salinus]